MKLTPINSAEAILEAFYDEQLSGWMEHWTCEGAAEGLARKQGWAMAAYEWARTPADESVAAMRAARTFTPPVPAEDYDTLIFSIVAPPGSRVTLRVGTERGERSSTSTPFAHLKRELGVALEGAREVRALSVEIFGDAVRAPGPVSGWFNWIGLQEQRQLARHLRQFERFDARWEDYLKPESYEPTFEPVYGLHLTGAELAAARGRLAAGGGRERSPLEELAVDAARTPPERMMSGFVNFWNDTRFTRERDYGKHLLTHGANAAQAAVLFRDQALGRLAARYAMAMAHSERWDSAFVCWMTGSLWEHRAFVPSLVMYECALILDLCGEWFTDYGRDLILRRLAEEGHGTNNYNTWWWEYLFWCNQAAWFMPGRMYAYLVLERTMPARWTPYPRPAESRVAPYTELALADLMENLRRVLLPDGGYTEGPMYFTWTARQAFISLYYYARARGKEVRSLVPPAMLATARMAEVLVSTDDAAQMIMICDAQYLNQESLAALAWLMPDSHWVTIFRKSLAHTGGQPLTLLTANLLAEIPAAGPAWRACVEMRDIGQMASHRRLGGEWVKLFLMGNQAGASHTHEDKGSFVLEFAGDSFALDFGMCDYSNPLGDLMKHAQRHNMLVPVAPGMRPRPANPILADITPTGSGDERALHARMELAAGWEGWFTRWQRAWDAETPAELTITDEWELAQGEGVAFHWTTPLPIALSDDGRSATIEGRRGRARLTWSDEATAVVEQLPLEEPRWKDVMRQRKEMALVVRPLPATQPRLTLTQRGRRGRLVVNVRLEVK
ncbi:heparinase II/III-family protein [Horticoccus luteus]|uniref:Heparinase II/III-family protein n=1 Tax=Horticoccus luteus TaxID=2862869 RepID=A0A8F9TU81_9BACT|nr:heparinase II/III family protein [Horticoccus luteus]QYM79140.1 heparinase II/III-family protein [Horticoccus luteus]